MAVQLACPDCRSTEFIETWYGEVTSEATFVRDDDGCERPVDGEEINRDCHSLSFHCDDCGREVLGGGEDLGLVEA